MISASFSALQLASGGRMRSFVLVGAGFGEAHPGQYWSLGGFGNVLYPGTGHAPTATPPGGAFTNGFAPRGGVTTAHPQHRRTAIVPYPVYYGGYGYGGNGYGYDPSQGYAPGYGDQPPVINSG